MNDRPISKVVNALERVIGRRPARNGDHWTSVCPAHADSKPSLSIREGDDDRALLHCFGGCPTEAVVRALGLTMRDLMPPRLSSTRPATGRNSSGRNGAGRQGVFKTADEAIAELERRHGKRSADWTYTDAAGNPVGVMVRWNLADGDKDFRPVSRNGAGWSIGAMPEPRRLYGLPDLLARPGERVFVCEGEKAADAARSVGLLATTSPHGSNSGSKADWSPLAGRDVVILPDKDSAGRQYADDVVALLAKLNLPAVVRVVELPELPDGGDVFDFVAARRSAGLDDAMIRAEIEALADAAEPVDARSHDANYGPVLICLADVQPEPVRWLWRGRIPLGKLTIVGGDPGLGKSFLTLDVAARVSRGTPWPDALDEKNEPGGVVLLNAEDDRADTIRPRLDAAGADVSQIHLLEAVRMPDSETGKARSSPFTLTADLAALEAAIEQVPGCRLVVVDPISAYLGRTDSHVNSEVRAVLAPLAELAMRKRVAVVAVHHLRKVEGPALYRLMGSLAFVAAARAVWGVTKDAEDAADRRRLFLPIKCNIAPDPTGLAFSILRTTNDAGCVGWEPGAVRVSAEDALGRGESAHDAGADAAEFLRELLAEGEQKAADVLGAGRANGFTDKAIRRAFKAIGGRRRREGFGVGGIWYWALGASSPDASVPIDAPIVAIDAFDAVPGNKGNNGATMESSETDGAGEEECEWVG